MHNRITAQTWKDIEITNRSRLQVNNRPPAPPIDFVTSMETHRGRLTPAYHDDGHVWRCVKCPLQSDRQKSIRGQLSAMRGEARNTNITFPYYPEIGPNMRKLKNHICYYKCIRDLTNAGIAKWHDVGAKNENIKSRPPPDSRAKQIKTKTRNATFKILSDCEMRWAVSALLGILFREGT